MKHKTVYTGGQKTPGLLFQGEMMICKRCGARKRSRPDVESGWTALQMDNIIIYICPKCWVEMGKDKS